MHQHKPSTNNYCNRPPLLFAKSWNWVINHKFKPRLYILNWLGYSIGSLGCAVIFWNLVDKNVHPHCTPGYTTVQIGWKEAWRFRSPFLKTICSSSCLKSVRGWLPDSLSTTFFQAEAHHWWCVCHVAVWEVTKSDPLRPIRWSMGSAVGGWILLQSKTK